jgi:hypothetical protein
MSKLFVDEIVHASSQGSGTITIGASGEKVDLGTGVSGGTLTNTPAFEAKLSSSQVMTNASTDKLQLSDKILDTDNCYDATTNYRFTPNVAGKYFIHGQVMTSENNGTALQKTYLRLRKNGSDYSQNFVDFRNNPGKDMSVSTAVIIDFNGSTDYVELWVYYESNAHTGVSEVSNAAGTFFGGYKLIGA